MRDVTAALRPGTRLGDVLSDVLRGNGRNHIARGASAELWDGLRLAELKIISTARLRATRATHRVASLGAGTSPGSCRAVEPGYGEDWRRRGRRYGPAARGLLSKAVAPVTFGFGEDTGRAVTGQ